MQPEDALTEHMRLTPMQVGALKRLDVMTIRDLLYHFPSRYDQGGAESAIEGLVPGSEATVFGTIGNLDTRRSWKRKIPVGEATIKDATGSIKVMWFHQPYLAKKFFEGQFVKAVGTVSGTGGKAYLANPHVELADPTDTGLFSETRSASSTKGEVPPLFAVYPESRGITSLWMRHAMEKILKTDLLDTLDDPIPPETLARYNLPPIKTALVWIHMPADLKHAEAARKRFSFEEIFIIHVARAKERAVNDAEPSFPIESGRALVETFLSSVDFPPTGAQRRAIDGIMTDFERSHPMARLLEGDVGSGKTLVAAAVSYAAVSSRPKEQSFGTLQVAYMAPTEILAGQHFQSFVEYFKDLPINIALITGSGCKKFPSKSRRGEATDISRAQLLKWVESGEVAMIVGTHALIQKSVRFKHLALCIVDEQHRFGTAQRRALARKGGRLPHFLSMTATPIPRTLALTLYGDLDLSILDELPPGRVPIETHLLKATDRADAYGAIRVEVEKGHQAYVICPRIEEPDPSKVNALQAKSAKTEAARLQKEVFPEYVIGLLHGAMKPKEKNEALRRFTKGESHILVATSVVEVGVNVPNATVILIEGAERFGLSQLHQLRGRVMRSSHPPRCFLLPETTGEVSMKRLRALEKSADGFALAEADLAQRGAGDLWGRQQWGVSDLGMEALKNPRLIQAARDEAHTLIMRDPLLARHQALARITADVQGELHSE